MKKSTIAMTAVLAYHYSDNKNYKAWESVINKKGRNWKVIQNNKIVFKSNNSDDAENYYDKIKDTPSSRQ